MSFEKESSSSGVDLESEGAGEFQRSAISYTRDFLLSVAEFDACKELPDGVDHSILGELLDVADGSTPELLPQANEPLLWIGSSGSSRESAERWDSCKLSLKESTSTGANDSGRWYCNQSRHLSPNSGNIGNLRSSMQDHNGILGSWSGSKQSKDGSEESSSKLQETKPSLLSRCNEPYRPPAFYKAISHSGCRNHNSFNHESSIDGRDPSRTRAMEEKWRKDSYELAGDSQLKAFKEKQEFSADNRKVDSDPDVQLSLQECFDVPGLLSNEASGPMYLAESGPVEPYEAAEMYAKTESSSESLLEEVHELPFKSQTGMDSGGVCYEEKLEEQLFEESRFFALVDLTGAENIGPNFPDKKNIMAEVDNFKSQSKFLNWFLDSEKESSNVLSWGDKGGKRACGEATELVDENRLSKEISFSAQRAPVSEARKVNVAECGSSHPVGLNSCLPCGFSHDSRHSWGPQLDRSPRMLSPGASLHITPNSEPQSVPKCGQNAALNLEILLPDEDSLIKIDDTYIFQQDVRTPSPNIAFKGGRSTSSTPSSKKLGLENRHHNLSLQDPWSLESGMNGQKLFVNPLDSQAHLNDPRTIQDPWKTYHNGYGPVATSLISHPFGQLQVKPQIYEQSVQHFLSPRMRSERFGPHLHNAISPEPSIYHQAHQIPYCQLEPNPLRSPPLNYQRNVNPHLDVGRRGGLGEEGNKSAFCHLLQMQMRLAQMNLEAASSSDERVYGKPINQWFW